MCLAKNLKYLRLKNHLSQEELADMLGYKSFTTIQKWESGVSEPNLKIVKKLSNYYHVNINDLVYTDLQNHGLSKIQWNDNVEPSSVSNEFISIPVLGSVPAGVPIEAVQDIIDTIKIPSDFVSDDLSYFALRVKGDSMYPMYLEGDTIIVELRHDCESGQDAIVYVNGYDATLKTVLKNDDGTITLHPRNPEWPEKTYGPDDEPIEIVGPVVQQIRMQ